MNELIPLADVLIAPSRLDWRHGLFLPKVRPWTLQTVCAVLDSQLEEEPDPELMNRYGLAEALGLTSFKTSSAISNSNLRRQQPNSDWLHSCTTTNMTHLPISRLQLHCKGHEMSLPNNALVPTRKGEAPLLAAQRRRWAGEVVRR